MTLDEIALRLKTLKDTNGSIAKKQYLTKSCDTEELKYLLTVLLDSQYALGIKKLRDPGRSVLGASLITFDVLKEYIERLQVTNLNDTLRGKLSVLLGSCTIETQPIIKELLQKTLKVGVTAKTLNEVFKGIIPEHPIALAKSPTEAEYNLPCIVSTKYDGIRYTQVKIDISENGSIMGRAMTRDRNVMKFTKIENGIHQLLKGQVGSWVIDGELETLDEDFSKVQGIVSSNIDGGVYEDRNDLKLTVFDLIRYSDYIGETKSKPQAERLKDISRLFMINKPDYLVEGQSCTVYSVEKVKELTDACIAKGLEGTIIKDPKASYKKGKTSAWIKQKAINDTTLKCIGITISEQGKRTGKVRALVMETSDGLIKVHVGSGLTDEMVELYTTKPPINQFFDVLFNVVSQAENGQMSLRLPRLKGPRIDVKEADTFDKIKSQHIGKMLLKGEVENE